MSRVNLQKFFVEYMYYWGEATAVVEVMGDAGELVASLRNYMTTSEDEGMGRVIKELGDLYLSLNILIEHAGRDKVMPVVMAMANQRRAEMERNKEEKTESGGWDELDRLDNDALAEGDSE